jgi:hypothetical protein
MRLYDKSYRYYFCIKDNNTLEINSQMMNGNNSKFEVSHQNNDWKNIKKNISKFEVPCQNNDSRNPASSSQWEDVGFSIGSKWYSQKTQTRFYCLDASYYKAIWSEIVPMDTSD